MWSPSPIMHVMILPISGIDNAKKSGDGCNGYLTRLLYIDLIKT